MKSDLTCPVEILSAEIHNESNESSGSGRIVCLIDFLNLSEKEINSIQLNVVCYNSDNDRLGGRLIRAAVHGDAKSMFTGAFVPEHVDGVTRIESSVEKVWYSDGVLWRREERNVREYEPNLLNEGRELDRLRMVAGPDARGYAREDDAVWMCVCGRANRTSDGTCMRCGRERAFVLKQYSFEEVDKTVGNKERDLERQTRENVRRSSEQTAWEAEKLQKKKRRRKKITACIIALLAVTAVGLAGWRWGYPAVLYRLGDIRMAEGRAGDAKALYERVYSGWPDYRDAKEKSNTAELSIIDGLIRKGTEESLKAAAERASSVNDYRRQKEANLKRAELLEDIGEVSEAEALLRGMAGDPDAENALCKLVYEMGETAQKQLDYTKAIERFSSLGTYKDSEKRRTECIYLYGRQLLREHSYSEACNQFELIAGYQDTIPLLRSARYGLAIHLQEERELQQAAQLFESLGMYEDSASRARGCRYQAGLAALETGNMELAAEQFNLAEDYEDAKTRFEEVAFELANRAMETNDWEEAIGWLTQITRNPEVLTKLNTAVYSWAEHLLTEGRREEAAIEFSSLGDYSDSRERSFAISYQIAKEEMLHSPEEALTRFEALGNYQDSAELADECRRAWAEELYRSHDYERAIEVYGTMPREQAYNQIQRCRYALAGQLMEGEKYTEAAAQFSACGTYLDAEERTLEARYAAAGQLENEGEYPEAAAAFEKLEGYADAKAAQIRCEDKWLRDRWSNAHLDYDVGNYSGVIQSLEELWEKNLPKRYSDIPALYENACIGLAQELIGLGKPFEALPYLRRIPENKTAQKKLNDYVYRILGRWKETRGTEFLFREDGSCKIAESELFFGGSGYEIFIGETPYPQNAAYLIISLRGSTLTLKELSSGRTLRLAYLDDGRSAAQGFSEDSENLGIPSESVE